MHSFAATEGRKICWRQCCLRKRKQCAGEAVKIAALGGSVTVGHNVENKQTAWLYRVFDWVNTTFPHPDHEFINAAIPAVTSAYVAPCVLDLLPGNLDLVFLVCSFQMPVGKSEWLHCYFLTAVCIIQNHASQPHRVQAFKESGCWKA